MSLKVSELKEMLKERNLPISGNKADLVDRLMDSMSSEPIILEAKISESVSDDSSKLNGIWKRILEKKWETNGGIAFSLIHVIIGVMVIFSTAGIGIYTVSQFSSKVPEYKLVEFDSSRAREYTQMLVDLGDPGRHSGSIEEQATVDAIQQNFTEMGLMLQYETFNVPMFDILSEPELAICIPGQYPLGIQSPTPC